MNVHSIGIYVVATAHRPAIVLEHLTKIPHHVCWTKDYKFEKGWKPEQQHAGLVQNQVGHLRAWRGHQDAMRFFRDQTPQVGAAFILEDDAWPNNPLWLNIAVEASNLLENFEVVSLHGRAIDRSTFEIKPLFKEGPGPDVLIPKNKGKVWVQGCLAYFIRRDAVDKFINQPYTGYPDDIYLCNEFKFALIDPSPFDHNRVAGSLIDCPIPADGWET